MLDVFEAALKGNNVTALRPRLEHAQMMTKADMVRLSKLGGDDREHRATILYTNLVCQSLPVFSRRTRMCFSSSDLLVTYIYPSFSSISDMWYAQDRLVSIFSLVNLDVICLVA